MRRDIVIYGDPHGDYAPLIEECEANGLPESILILGDMSASLKDCEIRNVPCLVKPMREELKPLLDAGVDIKWIPGNHDTDTPAHHEASFMSFPEGNIHGKIHTTPSGLRIAGLGGVFRGKIWFPHDISDPARFDSQDDLLNALGKHERWHKGIPLRHRSSIFKSDMQALIAQGDADILITHEAPNSLEKGFYPISQLASDLNARVIFHGHHHIDYSEVLPNGIHVRGVGKATPFRVTMEVNS